MRYAIISDIHSNLHALQSAISIIDTLNIDTICCLGDVVGYNAFPCECIDLLKNHSKVKHCIMGNHDFYAVDGLRFSNLNDQAYECLVYSTQQLNQDKNKDKKMWLDLCKTEEVIEDLKCKFLMVHGHPVDPMMYILEHFSAASAIKDIKERGIHFCFYGHTHLPSFASRDEKGNVKFYMQQNITKSKFSIVNNDVVELDFSKVIDSHYFLINPGAIGQPRNKSSVGFGVFDTDKLTFRYRTFEYDIKAASDAILKAGYSDSCANRLMGIPNKNKWIQKGWVK